MGLEKIQEQLDEQRCTACQCGTNTSVLNQAERAKSGIQQNLQDYSWDCKNCCIVKMYI